MPPNRQERVGKLALSFEDRYKLWQESIVPLQQAKKTGGGRRYIDEA